MVSKAAFYTQMAEETARQVTGSREQWTAFLTTAARLYKYPYNEQLMIYKQRPDATACAEYDLWNNTMRRYVRRGSKGIALVDLTGERPRLRYVFDVSDTGARANSRPVNLWSMKDEYLPAVRDALERAYGVDAGMRLDEQMDSIAARLAAEYWNDNRNRILGIVDDSFLYGYDEFNVGVSFRRAAEASIRYMLYSRCVEEPESYFEPEDFMDVFDFNTQAASNVLGTAVSEVSSQVFREVERAIRTYERAKQVEQEERSQDDGRADLHAGRGLPDPGHSVGGDGGPSAGQVRQDAQGISDGEQPASLQPSGVDREAVPTPVGGAGHGGRPDPADDGRTAGGGPGAGQENPADGLGAAHERAESTGGGDRDSGAYHQLTLEGMFPSEMEQISLIDRKAESEKPSAFSIPDAEIDRILRQGSAYDGGKLRISVLYAQENTPAERAAYLKDEYGISGGRGWQFSDGSRGGVQNRPQGIIVRNAERNTEIRLRWSEVEKRISALIEAGQYLGEPDKQRYSAMEADYAAFGGVPLPKPGYSFPPTPAEIYDRYYPVVRDALLRDTAYRNACANNDKETALMEGGGTIERAVLTIQDPAFMKLYFDVPEYHDRLHQTLLDETYEVLTAAPELPDPPSHTSAMLAQAARMADKNDLASPERFSVIETEGGYAIWDDIREEIYVDPDGVSEEFTSEWQAEDYLAQVKKEVAERDAADWLKAEQAKLPPPKYAIGDWFTIYPDGSKKEIVLTGIADNDVFYVYPDEPGQDQVFMDRGAFEQSLRTGHIRETQPKEAVQTIASYRNDDEPIVIQRYPNGQFYTHYGYDEQNRFSMATAGGFPSFEEAEAALRSHRSNAERVMEGLEEVHGEPVLGAEAAQTPGDETPDEAQGDAVPAAPENGDQSVTEPEEPRYFVIMTSDAFPDPEDAYAIWDTIEDAYYSTEDGRVATFPDEETAQEYLDQLNEKTADHTVKQNPSYQVGDTVYLENTAYIVEDIGLFDVRLRDPSLAYPILRSESRENLERLLWADARNSAFLPGSQVTTTVPNYEVTVSILDAPTLHDRLREAGISAPQFIHESGDVTFSFSEPDRDAVERLVSDLRVKEPAAAQDAPKPETKPKMTVTAETTYSGDRNGMPFDVVIRRVRFDEPERVQPEQERPQQPKAENFRIMDDHLGEGGPKEKFWRNIKAIATLKQIESEGRAATREEQHILSQYVGWGGLADAFDDRKNAWATEFAELNGLLTDEEYVAARASTLNAHYTSPTVIRAIYDAVERMGFQSGNILEPSMGVGNFFGMLPEAMRGSRLYGVELDSITGRIAQQLYPNADIKVAGFQTTDRRDFYDLCVGNVPFGDYKVNDKAYNKLGFSIHNYFIAKAIDQVRPGGVVAVLTSRYTMDAKNPDARKHIAQKAELLGAIRLPNNAFKANAGTEVVSDILFLQKRNRPIDIEPDWVHLGQTPDGFAVNSYFVDHPEMVLGELTAESTQYGRQDLTVAPIPGAVLSEQLQEAVSHIRGQYQAAELAGEDIADAAESRGVIPADPDVKNFSYALVDGQVYFRENSIMRPVELSDTAKGRVAGMIGLRQIVGDLIEYQLEDYPDEDIRVKQAELNTAYDAFHAKYGTINSSANARVFDEDSSYYLLCSLENVDEDKRLVSKADMFTKRTIRPERTILYVDTPSEALAVSIGERGRVDLRFMSELLGRPGEYDRITEELQGVIFRDPREAVEDDPLRGWHTADDYLSGNVRDKLMVAQMAAANDPAYAVNVAALEKAQPRDLDASEIDVRLGATWISRDYIQQFMEETFETPWRMRNMVQVQYSPATAEWQVTGKNATGHHDVMAYMTYGTDRASAYRILEDTLNLRDVRIYDIVEDADGKQKRVLNKKETTLAQQKQQAIKDAFRDWVWRDPRRREDLVRTYNELFNSTRPREYDGSHIVFGGMNPDITLRDHQRGAIAHVLYGGNTLLAHEVGAGKTFEMAASAMESKRLGLCQKSLFVVPNHLTLQWASEFLRLYPSAKLLVASRKDFETANRKKFCARIATGDYDAVIIGHSQFEKIPVSAERQERILQGQMDEITDAIAEMKAMRGENFTIKQLEKTRKSLEARMEKLQAAERKDDVITFEQLGVDRLYVDEAHAFKNLFLHTKMRNVAGLSTSEAQKSSDMFMKCQYMDELTGGKGTVFATGTPVSNSMTELYTMMRYLQHGTLQQKGLTHFDQWASTFGETTTAIELAPEGTGYRARTRFAKFFNLPELMSMFKEVADIKTADQLHLPVPEARFETVVVQPSEIQKEMVAELSKRASAVHSGVVDPSVDNMLKITSDGRKIGLDQRLINPLLPDDENSKLNACVRNVLRIWEEGKTDRLTQLLFCDLSTPKGDGTFNVYDDIRDKLVAARVPAEEIAFIHSADTDAKKKELFGKVRTGEVRVLLGSTQKMGAGTNVQDRLVAVHHLDVGWRPSDMTQRNGRIIRQGNRNKEVQVYQYVTEGTFDAYLYQTLENKQKFISQIMTSKSPVRSCDDVDEQALSYAEIKALCAGNPLIREKMDLDVDVARLKVLRADYQSKHFRLEDQLLKYFPAEIEAQQSRNRGFETDIQTVSAHPVPEEGFVGMEVGGRHYGEKAEAGEAILALCKETKSTEGIPIGSYRGFQMELSYDAFEQQFQITLKGEMRHRVSLGLDARGNLTRLDNALAGIPARLERGQEQLETLQNQQAAAQVELTKPFPQEAELAEKSARLAELDAALSMDNGPSQEGAEVEEEIEGTDKSGRPSVLEDLKKRAAGIPPDRSPGKEPELD